MTIHAQENCSGEHNKDSRTYKGADYSTDFYIFSVEWDERLISWKVNGAEKRNATSLIPTEINGIPFFLANEAYPFQPMNIIANLAIEGGKYEPSSTAVFPLIMEIDYIRMWAKAGSDDAYKICNNTNLNNNSVQNVFSGSTITIGGQDCNDSITINNDLAIIASNEIIFKPGFISAEGSNLIATIANCQNYLLDKIKPDTSYNKEMYSTQFLKGEDILHAYPNPNNGNFVIYSNDAIINLLLGNWNGMR